MSCGYESYIASRLGYLHGIAVRVLYHTTIIPNDSTRIIKFKSANKESTNIISTDAK